MEWKRWKLIKSNYYDKVKQSIKNQDWDSAVYFSQNSPEFIVEFIQNILLHFDNEIEKIKFDPIEKKT